ncbi:MAG: MGMT family protein [Actinomycetaceae bacterium]|nr:MGMT family protein [Actinomycetaceae bacterium]
MGAFAEEVYAVVCRIPPGTVATYGQIATAIGKPHSARFVGYALHANPRPGVGEGRIPCHRVVFKDGSLCRPEVFAGIGSQLELLADEGVLFIEGDDGELRVDMEHCHWQE